MLLVWNTKSVDDYIQQNNSLPFLTHFIFHIKYIKCYTATFYIFFSQDIEDIQGSERQSIIIWEEITVFILFFTTEAHTYHYGKHPVCTL